MNRTQWIIRPLQASAAAYLPVQDITDGVVTLAIIEGRIVSHRINNQARLSDSTVQAHFSGVKDGDVIKAEQIDRGLLILQDTPGVGSAMPLSHQNPMKSIHRQTTAKFKHL